MDPDPGGPNNLDPEHCIQNIVSGLKETSRMQNILFLTVASFCLWGATLSLKKDLFAGRLIKNSGGRMKMDCSCKNETNHESIRKKCFVNGPNSEPDLPEPDACGSGALADTLKVEILHFCR
jgi:hypothetical protein